MVEWEIGQFGKARSRWETAKNLSDFDESYALPADFDPSKGVQPEESSESFGSLSPLPEKDRADVNFLELGSETQPFVIRNFWNIPNSLSTEKHSFSEFHSVFKQLLTNYSQSDVAVYPQNMRIKPIRLYHKTLLNAIQFLYYPNGAFPDVDISEQGTYIQWNANSQDFTNVFYFLRNLTTTDDQEPFTLTNDLFPFFRSLIRKLPLKSQRRYHSYLPPELFVDGNFEQNNQEEVEEISPIEDLPVDPDEDDEDDDDDENYVDEEVAEVGIDQANLPPSKELTTNLLEKFGQQTHWYMVLIGEEHAGMFHHLDNLPVASWQIQILGEKKWILCAPTTHNDGSIKNLHFHLQTLKNHNKNNNHTCFETILSPGDLLFYSNGYSHETLSLNSPTLSISGTLIPRRDYHLLKNVIRKECDSGKIGYSFHQMLCRLVNEPDNRR